MAERGIIFSGAMVRALLQGRKTQTRRLLKVPTIGGHRAPVFPPEKGIELEPGDFARGVWHYLATGGGGLSGPYRLPAAVGDRLWVRETYAKAPPYGLRYSATDAISDLRKKIPAIHMPRVASRVTLVVEAVRVEALHAISEDDARAEGTTEPSLRDQGGELAQAAWSERQVYQRLWNHIHGPGSWEVNPQVVALTFRVVPGNIDQVRA
jgi:hypothetical protein